jgi:twitching motility two-component system response regulator PilG
MNDAVVLIVDDSPTVRKIVQLTLQREGFNVIAASDGLGALAAVSDYQPDLILLDIVLPHMDGYHICQIIRKNPDFRETPIIMLSGRDGLFDKMRGRLAGSSEYLTKPFDSTELVATVRRHLANAPRRVRSATPSTPRPRRLAN